MNNRFCCHSISPLSRVRAYFRSFFHRFKFTRASKL